MPTVGGRDAGRGGGEAGASLRAVPAVAPARASSGRGEDTAEGLPVTLATVTVAGQCRERSPADEAVFGPSGARFTERFIDAGHGQRLLARAVADGIAEGSAVLRTVSGPLPCRVSLWRQRSGERIRLVAAFAADAEDASSGPRAEDPGLGALARFAALLRTPAEAALALAHRLRSEGAAPAAEAVAALWRVVSLVGDMQGWRPGTLPGAGRGADECDLLRLARRVMRLADPQAARTGVVLVLPDAATDSAVLVIADQGALWGGIEEVVCAAIERAGAGGTVRAALDAGADAEGLALRLAVERDGTAADDAPALASPAAEALLMAAGARLALDEEADAAVIRFAPERCVPLP